MFWFTVSPLELLIFSWFGPYCEDEDGFYPTDISLLSTCDMSDIFELFVSLPFQLLLKSSYEFTELFVKY